MSAATISPARGPAGATPLIGVHTRPHQHRVGDALRAIKVFARAAFDVILLGEYAQEAGVRRR